MTRPLTGADLRRSADLVVISAAFDGHMPHLGGAKPSQMHVAELCRLNNATRRDRNPMVTRDRLMAIAAEWDLDGNPLSDQSDMCVHELAELLRPHSSNGSMGLAG